MIVFAFLLSLIPFSLQVFVYGPTLPILPFIPFLAVSLLTCSFPKTLFLSMACGLLVDLFSADPFGMHTLNYVATSFLCYRGKSFFSADSTNQFLFYTAICSFVFTSLQMALLFLFDRRVYFQGTWWLVDWTMLPLLDALYALIWFKGPIALFQTCQRFWGIYWLKRKARI